MDEVPKVDDVKILLDKLGWVGTIKLNMSITDHWWFNELGLYVQLRYAAGQGRLQAGGKYKSYFDAWGTEGKDFKLWGVRKYDKETWNRRFAHLVWPTYEIALFMGVLCGLLPSDMPVALEDKELGQLSGLNDAMLKNFREEADLRTKQAIKHFNKTGEWTGSMIVWRCKTCSHRLGIWQVGNELCPYCGGKITG